MNGLAHLAADPDAPVGSRARSALLDLVGFLETAGEAAVRLPVHLLDSDERARLLNIHEPRVEILTRDPVLIPQSLNVLRDNRVIRGAVWQTFDARHLA